MINFTEFSSIKKSSLNFVFVIVMHQKAKVTKSKKKNIDFDLKILIRVHLFLIFWGFQKENFERVKKGTLKLDQKF